jgi:hypothetical protein
MNENDLTPMMESNFSTLPPFFPLGSSIGYGKIGFDREEAHRISTRVRLFLLFDWEMILASDD